VYNDILSAHTVYPRVCKNVRVRVLKTLGEQYRHGKAKDKNQTGIPYLASIHCASANLYT